MKWPKMPKIILGTPLVFVSPETFFGAIFGYFLGKIFGGQETGKGGIIKSIAFEIGNYRLHLHHWFIALGVLASTVFFNFSLPFPYFIWGVGGGLIFQGVSCYSDWSRIIIKKRA